MKYLRIKEVINITLILLVNMLNHSCLEKLKILASREDLKIRIRKEVFDAVDQLERDWNRIIAAMGAAQGAQEGYLPTNRSSVIRMVEVMIFSII